MAQDTFVRDWKLDGEQDPTAIIRYLSEIEGAYDTVTAFFISDATRRYYHPDGVLKTLNEDDPADGWYFRARAMDDDFEVNVDWDTADRSRLTIFINYKVFDYSGNFIGITGVGLNMTQVQTLFDTYQEAFGRTVYLIDATGAVTIHSTDYAGPLDITRSEGLNAIAPEILRADEGAFTYTRDGHRILLNSRLVPELHWVLMVEQSDVGEGGLVLQTLLINLAISAGICVIVLALANITVGGYQRRLEQMATTDKLTGLANRQAFEAILAHDLAVTERSGQPVSGLLFDLDNFKSINDRFGHLAGDQVLKAFAKQLRARLRDSDAVCRWGGEEFIATLPGASLKEATRIAEQVRAALGETPIVADGREIAVTVSIGVAQSQPGEDENGFVRRLDEALYAAKNDGRNRVVAR